MRQGARIPTIPAQFELYAEQQRALKIATIDQDAISAALCLTWRADVAISPRWPGGRKRTWSWRTSFAMGTGPRGRSR